MTASVEVGGERLLLLPEKAALVEAERALLVADVHLGKGASFRRLGVPVPAGATAETLARLGRLVERHAVRRVVFLGDLLHSRAALKPETLTTLAAWRRAHPRLDLTLVRGNHDRHAGDPPAALGIEVVDEPLPLGRLALAHYPRPHPSGYVLAGHLHPCATFCGRAGDRLRLPCFWFGEAVGVLPAFGEFTGMHPIEPRPGDHLYAVTADGVAAVPAPGVQGSPAMR